MITDECNAVNSYQLFSSPLHRIKSRIVKLIALIIKHDAEISHAD